MNKETRLIPISNLNSENVLYWKCFSKASSTWILYRRIRKDFTWIIHILYIHLWLCHSNIYTANRNVVNHMQKFILLQLFEITTTYDLSDEVGRKKLNELMCNTLVGNHWTETIIECIVTHLQKVIPDVNSRLNTLANIISEIRLPLKEPVATQISEQQQHEINVQVSLWLRGTVKTR